MTKPPLRSTGACSTTVGSKPAFLSQNASVGPAIPAPEIRTDLELITEGLVGGKLNARRLVYGLPQRNWRSHDARRSTSIQPLYFCCDSGWLDVPDRGWNRQLAAGDTQPIRHSLATVMARLLANDAAGRRASGPDDSICFISSDEQ